MIKAEKVFDEVFSARNFNSSPLTISNLDGDFYDYELLFIGKTLGAVANGYITFNGDSTANYRLYQMVGAGSGKSAVANDSWSQIYFDLGFGTDTSIWKLRITGSSGDERHVDMMAGINSSTNKAIKSSQYWKNTADNITSLEVKGSANTTSDAHIMLYRTPKAAGQSEWELMEVKSWSTQNLGTTPVIFSTVAGDTDLQYKISVEVDTPSATSDIRLRFNSDSGNNYIHQELRNVNATIGASNTTSNNGAELLASKSTTAKSGSWIINAESGVERLLSVNASAQAAARDQTVASIWWTNTADELDTIAIHSTVSTNQTGTAKLYRKRNPAGTGDTLPFEVMYNKDVNQSMPLASKITFSNLGGESSNLIKIEGNFESGINTASATALRYQINGDTGSNYVSQRLMAISSATSAAASTAGYGIGIHGISNTQVSKMTMYIYPKSGDNRPILVHVSSGENRIGIYGQWWNNSADEIDSISFYTGASTTVIGNIKISRLVQ